MGVAYKNYSSLCSKNVLGFVNNNNNRIPLFIDSIVTESITFSTKSL